MSRSALPPRIYPELVTPRLSGRVPAYEPANEPYPQTPEQQDIYRNTRDQTELALWADPGLGKTRMTLDKAAYLWTEGKIRALTLLVPLKAVEVWPYQMDLWWSGRVPFEIGHYDGASMTKKQAQHLRDLFLTPWAPQSWHLRVMVFHHESFASVKAVESFKIWTKRWAGQSMLNIDESHHYKAPSAKRTKLLMKEGQAYKYRQVMSGTPMNEYMDLYSQYKVLDKKNETPWTGAKTATEYRAMYCTLRKMDRFDIIVGYRNVDLLMNRTRPVTVTLREQDCAKLPDVRSIDIMVPLSKEQKRIYTDLRDLFIAELDDGLLVTEQMAMLRIRRLQEVLSGFVRTEETETEKIQVRHIADCPRYTQAVEEFKERNVKTIIWCMFQPEILRLEETFKKEGIGTTLFWGGNVKDRMGLLRAFQANKEIDTLIMTAAAGGEALTILEPRHSIWFSHPWSYLKTHQANKRNHRIGQKFETVRTRLIAKGTVDSRILSMQDKRSDMSNILRTRGGTNVLRDLLASF